MNTAIVAGPIANKVRNGGAAWTRLSFVLGLRKLGFDVYFVEQISPDVCVDDSGRPAPFADSVNAAYFREITEAFGLGDRAALIAGDGPETIGLSLAALSDIAASATLLLNLSGHLSMDQLKSSPALKVYVDLDPGFTQAWQETRSAAARLDGHDYYFTVGENIGTKGCGIPTSGIRWYPIGQPVLLDEWPVSKQGEPTRFTTVASWRGPYGPVDCNGKTLGSKVREFRKYVDVPTRSDANFEIALDIHPGDDKDRELLCRNRWSLADPRRVTKDPWTFRDYVQTSGAEFSVAQEMYVETNSGWFSDRTVRYLASGKPVVVQDTGFSRNYPTGAGILPFRTPLEAVAAIAEVNENYRAHARAARDLAETYFDSDRVLGSLVEHVGACP